jgi:transposase
MPSGLTRGAVVHIDETVWYENGKGCWLWVLVTASTAIFMVGTRAKQELVALIGEAFLGWLVTDGYMAYRDHPRRQRCLAHLIRKARALAEGYYGSGCKFGHDLMRDLRALIHEIAEGRSQDGPHNTPRVKRLLARIKWTCQCNQDETEEKVRALAREILNDWDAVIAFVDHPDLPPTNNDAERILRQAVIARLTPGSSPRASFVRHQNTGRQQLLCRLSQRNRNMPPAWGRSVGLGLTGK